MGCNCKDTARRARKYTDEETLEKVQGAEKAAMLISKIFTVIFLFIILIVVSPVLILYLIFAGATGKKINIGNLLKKHGKRKQVIPNQD